MPNSVVGYVLAALQLVVLPLILWLGLRWLERRVVESARGTVEVAVGKALTEHKHLLDKQLAEHTALISRELEGVKQSLALTRERYAKDYGLFAERRNQIYSETYSLLEVAHGALAAHFGLVTEDRVFDRSPAADLRHLAKRLTQISEAEREQLNHHISANELVRAGELGTTLFKKDALRNAQIAGRAFRNASVLHSLYFSPAVEEILEKARLPVSMLEIYADEAIDGESPPRKEAAERVKELKSVCVQLRDTMRAEMQAGFSTPS